VRSAHRSERNQAQEADREVGEIVEGAEIEDPQPAAAAEPCHSESQHADDGVNDAKDESGNPYGNVLH